MRLDQEAGKTLKHLAASELPKREIARLLGLTEGAVRYHLRRQAAGETDGRARQCGVGEPANISKALDGVAEGCRQMTSKTTSIGSVCPEIRNSPDRCLRNFAPEIRNGSGCDYGKMVRKHGAENWAFRTGRT